MSSQTTILLALCAVFLAGWMFSAWRSRTYYRINNERLAEYIHIAAECRTHKKRCKDLADEIERQSANAQRRSDFIENFLLAYVSETTNEVRRTGPMIGYPELSGLSVHTPHGVLFFTYRSELDSKFKSLPLLENSWEWENYSTSMVHSNQRQVYADWLMTAELKLKSREQAQATTTA